MEIKWYMIGVGVMFAAMFGSLAYGEHTKAECRVAAIQAHMAVADIEKACE